MGPPRELTAVQVKRESERERERERERGEREKERERKRERKRIKPSFQTKSTQIQLTWLPPYPEKAVVTAYRVRYSPRADDSNPTEVSIFLLIQCLNFHADPESEWLPFLGRRGFKA